MAHKYRVWIIDPTANESDSGWEAQRERDRSALRGCLFAIVASLVLVAAAVLVWRVMFGGNHPLR